MPDDNMDDAPALDDALPPTAPPPAEFDADAFPDALNALDDAALEREIASVKSPKRARPADWNDVYKRTEYMRSFRHNPDKLTDKEARFVDEYLIHAVGVRAAVAAGYSPKSAAQIAHALINRPRVQDAIRRGKLEIKRRARQRVDDILDTLSTIVHVDLTQDMSINSVSGKVNVKRGRPAHMGRSINKVRHRISSTELPDGTIKTEHAIEVASADKIGAARLLLQQAGELVERHGGPDGEPLPAPTVNANVLVIKEVSE